ncbi:MAG TPA: alpha/beta hydrolase [Dongiaceae bacterium]
MLGVSAAVIGIYLAILAYLWATQRGHVFRPGIGPLDLMGSVVAPHMREVSVSTSDGLVLMAWYAPAKPGHRTIVYFHGNAGTLADRHERVLAYLERGLGVLLVGYRGYGGNPGRPSECGLYEDGRAHLDWLARRGIASDDLALYGESLGAAVAIQMAAERSASALVLEAPFASIVLSARARYPLFAFDWLIKDKFTSIDKIDKVRMPLLVIHGARDQVTPQRFGRMLYDRAREPKSALWLPEAGHNDLGRFGMMEAVVRFLDELPSRVSGNA